MNIDFSKIKNIFFDLDGTLLAMSDITMATEYPKLLIPYFTDVFTPEIFLKYFWYCTEAMFKHSNHNQLTLESFMIPFVDLSKLPREEAEDRFDRFYRNDFSKLQQYIEPQPINVKLIYHLKSQGKKLVLATNPVFPEIATQQRIRWAGLKSDDFVFVSHAENFYATKPDPKYYQDLLEIIDGIPSETLMVGNDYVYDGSASAVGIKTWITNRFSSNTDKKDLFKIDAHGSLEDLYRCFNGN